MYKKINVSEFFTVGSGNADCKKLLILLALLFVIPFNTNSQIPNGGFEEWIVQDEIEIPQVPWITNNLALKPNGVSYNPVTKSTDHYPSNKGNYSLRMENNISFLSEDGELLPFWACSYGFSSTAFYPGYSGPVFPVSGHPNSLHGYYKFLPQNNDTMLISISLFNGGEVVSSATMSSNSSVSDWTAFSISFPEYSNADSAQIGFSAFYTEPGFLPYGPHGNSILYIDNLSFDELINDVSAKISEYKEVIFYPNPASDIITLNIDEKDTIELSLLIYSLNGRLLKSEFVDYLNRVVDIGDLASGVYILEMKSVESSKKQKLIIQK